MVGKIGPHEGQELQLMLGGEKRLAYFSECDPEEEFEPYIAAGKIKRYVWKQRSKILIDQGISRELVEKFPDPTIYYISGAEIERDDLINYLEISLSTNDKSIIEECDRQIGRLLGYSEEDIDLFLGV